MFIIINKLFQMKQDKKAISKLGGGDKAYHETHNGIIH